MCIYVFKYVNAVVQAYVHADMWKPVRLMSNVFFTVSLPCFLRHGLLLNPELTNLTRLAIQQALLLHLSPPPPHPHPVLTTDVCPCTQLLHEILGSKVRCSCLHSKTSWTEPSPKAPKLFQSEHYKVKNAAI